MKSTQFTATRGSHSSRSSKTGTPMPLLSLALGMLVSYLPGLLPGNFGAGLSYVGWMGPLLGCAFYLMMAKRGAAFPWLIWLPWTIWVLFYLLNADAPNALQRTIMMVTPLVIAAGFSALLPTSEFLEKTNRWLRTFLWVFLAAAGVSTGLLTTGSLHGSTGFAAGSITASLLASWYATRYALGRYRPDLLVWIALSLIPVLANTRTGMVATAITLPLVLAPMPIVKRLAVAGVLVFAGLLVFQSERIQSKMFHSGSGSISDAVIGLEALFSGDDEHTDFATSGRQSMVRALRADIDSAYWTGHGANTTEEIAMAVTGVTHPHNDWLRLQYEYGTLGMALFAATLIMQVLHAIWSARQLPLPYRVYLYSGATAFIPMAIFMFSDNVILYVAWFGNLQFALLGLGYAVARASARTRRT